MERKVIDAPEFKFLDEGNGGFIGYASTFGNLDRSGEIVVKGAFAPHLESFLKDGWIALQHDWNGLPVGVPKAASEDDRGLLIEIAYHSTTAAQDARRVQRERMESGKSASLSIGYTVLDSEYTQEGRLLKELKLHEVSLVTVPANPLATVLASKGLDGDRLGFVEHSEAMVSAVEEYLRRAKDRQDFRAKEGRVLSEANRKRIATLLESLTSVQQELAELLAATEPKANPDTVKHLFIEYQRISAQLNGVQV